MILKFIPFASLYQEYVASIYAIDFLKKKGYQHEELDAYRLLSPAYSTYVFGAVFELIPSLFIVFYFPVIVVGHLMGLFFFYKKGGKVRIPTKQDIISKDMNWMALLSILPGLLIGFYFLKNIFGAILGGICGYFFYQELIKYKEKVKRLNGTIVHTVGDKTSEENYSNKI